MKQDIPAQVTSSAKRMCISTKTSAYLRLITAKTNHTPVFWINNSELSQKIFLMKTCVDLQVTAGPLKSF